MSSSTEIGSLSDLATNATVVQKYLKLDLENMRPDVWDRLRLHINYLQVSCPNHPGVLEARVRWYELALDSYEQNVVVVAEAGNPLNGDEWYPAFWDNADSENKLGLLATHYKIWPFLRRHYLKDEFPRLFLRLVGLYERLRSLSHLHGEKRERVQELIADLHQRLLAGRL